LNVTPLNENIRDCTILAISLHAPGMVQAEKKKCSVSDVTAKIVAAKPASNSTKAEACKFHDDKSLYTGVRTRH
jgi:p25-alpha